MAQQKMVALRPDDAGERADKVLCASIGLTRSALQKQMEQGLVAVDGKPIPKNYVLRMADRQAVVTLSDPEPDRAVASDIPLTVCYEDDSLLVINKPAGMVVHPAPGHADDTLVNALLHRCAGQLSGINGVMRPGILHRLDKDTSGLLLVAKTNEAHVKLAEQIKDHSFSRRYVAVLIGSLTPQEGSVSAPIGRNPNNRKKMCVMQSGGRPARTDYRTLRQVRGFSLVECSLFTGRTHQIRVHMAYLGHPVAGDHIYGPVLKGNQRPGQLLHAAHIGFKHPVTQRWMEFDTGIPTEFISFLDQFDR